MHYTDKKHLKKNILKIVIYTHGDEKGKEILSIEIASIQKCKFISDRVMLDLLKNQNLNLQVLLEDYKLKPERFYLLKLKQIGYSELSLKKIEDVTDYEKEIYYLH